MINTDGFHLTLYNTLDDTWQDKFNFVMEGSWQEQESDVLNLSTQRVDVNHTCQRIDGIMVLCNTNFGGMGWVGISKNR